MENIKIKTFIILLKNKEYNMSKKYTINIIMLLFLYMIFSKNTVSEVVSGYDNINVSSKPNIVVKKSKINLDRKQFSDYYIDRVTTFSNLEDTEGEIIFLGDSLIDICEWNELFNNNLIKNRGISGDTTYGVLNRLEQITEIKPSKIFIMLGINDIGKCRSTEDIIEDYKKILNKVNKDCPKTEIYVHSVLPINKDLFITHTKVEEILNFNRELNKLCNNIKVQYINLYPLFVMEDNKLNSQYTTAGIHLNGSGYLLWKQTIKKFL